MPLPAEISIPGYLEPPSQAQREQMDMAQQQLREKAAVQMQRRIAMAKLMGDANQLQAAGLDPTEARQQALVKNAPSLFPDDPETMLHVTTQVQTALARKKAIQDYKDELASGIAQKLNPEEAAARAWAKYGPDISTAGFFPGLTRLQTTQEQIDLRKQQMAQQQEEFKAREERIKTLKAQELGQKGLELGERTRIADQSEAGRQQRFQEQQKMEERKVKVQEEKAKKPTAAELKKQTELDEEIRATQRSLDKHLASKPMVFGKTAWESTKRTLETELEELKKQRGQLNRATATSEDSGDQPQNPNPEEFDYNPETRGLVPKK